MIWSNGWRCCSRRARKFALASVERKMRRQLLALILREYPAPMKFPKLAGELLENPDDMATGIALARAVRDLVMEG